jgi:mitotic-spindle organizing protein 1
VRELASWDSDALAAATLTTNPLTSAIQYSETLTTMPSQQDEKRQAAREVIDILYEISTLLVHTDANACLFIIEKDPDANKTY